MLSDIKEAIANLPDESFGEFYQEYVKRAQNSIISHNVNSAYKQYTTLEDTTAIIAGLNKITEELKFL